MNYLGMESPTDIARVEQANAVVPGNAITSGLRHAKSEIKAARNAELKYKLADLKRTLASYTARSKFEVISPTKVSFGEEI